MENSFIEIDFWEILNEIYTLKKNTLAMNTLLETWDILQK